MKKYKVGVIGATGMVGQRFLSLLETHPFFEVVVLAASPASSGKKYGDLMKTRWKMTTSYQKYSEFTVMDATADKEKIASLVDFVFCAVDMPKDEIRLLEEQYAKLEIPVISNNSACRYLDDVPMIIPEVNPEHAQIIMQQRKRLGTKHGFIAVKSNCSIQSYLPALHPLKDLGIEKILVCTYQAISGAGKTFDAFPEIIDNVIPFIKGEEEKTNEEPLKIWGSIQNGKIINDNSINITSQCIRVPVSDGHLAAVYVKFKRNVTKEEIIARWNTFTGEPQKLELPSAPKKFLNYFEEENRPQTKLDRDLEKGMAVTLGRLRADTQYDYKFIALSHNTIRGAAGGAILMAELLCKKGFI